MGVGTVKDGTALGRDRRIPKDFSFHDHVCPLSPFRLREPFVACPRSSSFVWRKRLCFLTICQPWWNNFHGRFSVVRLHNSVPDNGSLWNPWCMTAATCFRCASEMGEGLEKEWSNPSFDHLQLRGKKKNEKKSFSRVPRFDPKLSVFGLRPISHDSLVCLFIMNRWSES
jgi:hypothetical protein